MSSRPSDADILTRLREILPEEITPSMITDVLSFTATEAQPLFTPQLSFFVLGSYRDPEVDRVHFVKDTLNARPMTYAFLEADLLDIEHPDLPETHVKFHLLSTFTDRIVMVLEHGAGGAVTELADLTPPSPYFGYAYVFPRDYESETAENLGVSIEIGDHSPYSAVHQDKFALFAPDRLTWWATMRELADAVDGLPK